IARGSPLRKRHVKEYKKLGYERWRDKYRYGYRWRAWGEPLSCEKAYWGVCSCSQDGEHVQGGQNEVPLLQLHPEV
ncbi:MAG: hypothetical protein KIH08_10620, partial [Candidatus Freyarchaeota archaeon]|nr:hypothetical protein [Candidatus Jordarchaeia archaeon]